MKKIFVLILMVFLFSCQSKTSEIKDRTVKSYFEELVKLELEELIKQKILIDKSTLSPKYKDTTTNKMNKEGFIKYMLIKEKLYKTFFKDYLYQQKVEYNNDYYILYFSMAGLDDMEWYIIKMPKNKWNGKERLDKEEAAKDNDIKNIIFNYDEGAKNAEDIRIFIKNNYLIMERAKLYHSLYDLKNQKVLINEESPWHKSNANNKKELNNWIKENLHNKIENIINK